VREEHRLRLFGNRALRKIFGPTRGAVTGEWRRLHNEELYDVFVSRHFPGNPVKKNEMGGACSTYWEEESCMQDVGGET